MRFSVWPNPQQSWEDVLAVAQHAADTGWDGVWFADHFMPNAADISGPLLECWSVISGLAAAVPRVRIGALVSGNTYRHPAVLAKTAVTADRISGGRVVLGLGAGWQENEHTAYGIPFYDTRERLARLDEACAVITSLLANERSNFDGRFYTLKDAPLEPKAATGRMPLLVGGGGEKVTLRIAATYADEWNVWGLAPLLIDKMAVLDRHCADIGRDPKEIQRSANALLLMSDDEERVAKWRQNPTPMPALVGTPAEVRDQVQQYADAGVDELIVPDFTLGHGDRKLATYDLFRQEVADKIG